jgi:hypothetical protein
VRKEKVEGEIEEKEEGMSAATATTLSLITPNPLGGFTNGNTIIASSYLSPPHYSKPNPNFSSLFSFSVSLSSSNNNPNKHKPSLSSRQTTVSLSLNAALLSYTR